MIDFNYQFDDSLDWRSFTPAGFDADSLLELPVEVWFDTRANAEPNASELATLVESNLFEEVDGQLQVKEKAGAGRMLAERFATRKLQPNWGDPESIDTEVNLIKRFGILNEPFNNVLPDTFVLFHNVEKQDLVSLASREMKSGRNVSNIWYGLSPAIPFLKLKLDSLFALLELLKEKADSGSYGFDLYGAVARLSERQVDFGKLMLEKISSVRSHSLNDVLPEILLGMSRNEFQEPYRIAQDWISSGSDELVAQGCVALGAFDYSVTERNGLLGETVTALLTLEHDASVQVQVSLVAAHSRLLPVDARCSQAIERLAAMPFAPVKNRVAHVLFQHTKNHKNENWFRNAVNHLAEPCDEEIATFDTLDFLLASIAEEDCPFAIEFLERWLLNHSYDVADFRLPITKSFQSTLVAIEQVDEINIKHLMTKWFLEDDKRFHRAASDIAHELVVRRINGTPLQLELESDLLVDREFTDIRFVVHKIMGYVTDSHLLPSLVFSVLKSNQNQSDLEKLVVWAFRTYVGYNYPGGTYDLLELKLESGSDAEKKVARTCIEALDAYYDPLRDRPRIREFQPPTLRVREYDKEMRRLTRFHEDEARSESVLSQLFTNVTLKYGKKAAYQIEGRTQITEMIPFETSMEMPRGDLIDPVGMKHRRLVWRHEGREHLATNN